jgi:hypothetical protein
MAMRNISDFLVRKGVSSAPTAFQVRAPSQQQGLIGAENHSDVLPHLRMLPGGRP